jgi:hypothetical protein
MHLGRLARENNTAEFEEFKRFSTAVRRVVEAGEIRVAHKSLRFLVKTFERLLQTVSVATRRREMECPRAIQLEQVLASLIF